MKSLDIDLDFAPVANLMRAEAEAERFGGVALVVKGDNVLLEQTAGYALRWAKLPINRDTRFALASTGKLFTIVAIGQMVESGLVSLEDPITKFLPEHAHRAGWPGVKLRHLLTHSSGFGTYWGPEFEARRTTTLTVQDHFQLFEQTPLAFAPGSKFDYSNVGFILIGAIIERVSSQDYFDYIQQHIFDPVGMHGSGFFEADADTPNLAVGYTYRRLGDDPSRGGARTHTHLKPFKGSPAGDAISTAPDMVRFAQALLNGKILKRATFDQFCVPLTSWSPLPDLPQMRHGLGFMVIEGNRGTAVGHNGGHAGTNTFVFMEPATGLISVLLTNVDRLQAGPVNRLLMKTWIDDRFT
ncbi:MAG: serine hydrolase domain-containing protein [Burkholderiaceae bacterium]|nr:serine hydrolase domain-containing protein [Burkholderiaceae bacterium]